MGVPQKAAVARSRVGRMFHLPHMYERRNRRLLGLLQTEYRTDARGLKILVHRATAHDVDIALAMLGCVGVHRPDQRELVGTATEPGQLVTELQAGQICRSW